MIVSASYRTDIPGFYAHWFTERLEAGFCLTLSPFDGRLHYVDLRPSEVQGYVFWTRNVAPFLPVLERLGGEGMPFVVHYSLTGYPRALELRTPPEARAVELCRELGHRYGEHVLVWRYDPIVITSLTDAEWHRRHFENLCRRLEGASDEVVVSFCQMYRKTVHNLGRAARDHGFEFEDPAPAWKRLLLHELAQIAAAHGFRLTVCSQRELLCPGVDDASCIDPARLERVAGRPIVAARKPHRSACGCWQSVDIGEYDTCALGCLYCYAVRSPATGERRLAEHRPEDPLIWRPPRFRDLSDADLIERATRDEPDPDDQMALFEEQ